jgi:tetratricopeptide (TPR) repeat protein
VKMRLLLPVVAFLAASGMPVAAQAPEALFEEGNLAYQEGDYVGAASRYETVLQYGIRDPRLEYNLGNAYFKLGRLGAAILHYERAARLDPTDAEIAANLEFARSRRFDRVDPPDESAVVGWVRGIQNRIGPDGQAVIVLVMVWVVAGLVAWGAARPGNWNAALGWTLSAVVVITAVVGASWYTTYQRVEGKRLAVILDEAVEILAGPGENNASLFTVHEGLTVEVRDERSEWIHVSLPNGLNGWLRRDTVGFV